MKRKAKKILAFGLAVALVGSAVGLTACEPEEEKPPVLTDAALEGDMLADFAEGRAETVFESDGWTNGSVFNTQWSANNVAYENGAMKLTIDENPSGSEATNNAYFGGEGRTYQWFGYGDFEVRMKPAKKAGTASTFFTCTGNYDTNLEGEPNPWDEIDIEFLGKDTTQVQFNYYVNGQGGHEYMYDLGFDASEEFHNYGFRWTEDYICWFVDGKPVYKVEASEGNPMPAAAGRILMNYWCGTEQAEGWMGEYSNPGDEGPEYAWVKTSADVYMGELPGTSQPDDPATGRVPEIPEGTEAQALKFESASHTVTPAEDAADTVTVNYSEVAGNSYQPVSADISAVAGACNTFSAKIKNNGTESVNVRFDLLGANQNPIPEGLNTAATNLSAVKADGTVLKTDLEWGGSSVDVAAGEEVVIFITYNNADAQRGAVTTLNVFLDSARGDAAVYSGNVTLSEMLFFTDDGASGPSTPVAPEIPEGLEAQTLTFNSTAYTAAAGESGAVTLTYEGLAGNSYQPASADIAAIAGEANVFSVTIQNNGTETVNVRFDLLGANNANAEGTNTAATNVAAFKADGTALRTDSNWGGSFVDVGAGETVTVIITYDNTNATRGAAATLNVFLDSSRGDTATYSGSVTLSNILFWQD